MNEQKRNDEKIAVLIDYENVGLNTIQKLFDQLASFGKVTLKRAYADWSKATKSRDQILELGIEPVHVFRSLSRHKNTCDIRLTIDAIELLFTSSIDTFVIVSSDSDFVPLVNKLRSSGKKVYCAGDNSKTQDTLRISCNKYFEIEQNNNIQPVDSDTGKNQKKKANTLNSEKESQTVQIDNSFGQQIDEAWSKRTTTSGKSIPGPNAVADVVKILKIEKLKTSPYKTLQGVLEASPLLTKHWLRDKNTIVRK
jgi:uncharacterized protein (TIGR00288 family)